MQHPYAVALQVNVHVVRCKVWVFIWPANCTVINTNLCKIFWITKFLEHPVEMRFLKYDLAFNTITEAHKKRQRPANFDMLDMRQRGSNRHDFVVVGEVWQWTHISPSKSRFDSIHC